MYVENFQLFWKELTEEEANVFIHCPNVNPRSGRKIKTGKDIYNALRDVCRYKFQLEILPVEERVRHIDDVPLKRVKAPVRVQTVAPPPPNYPVPAVIGQWCGTYRNLDKALLYKHVEAVIERIDQLYTEFEADNETFFSLNELNELTNITNWFRKDPYCGYVVPPDYRVRLRTLLRQANVYNDVPEITVTVDLPNRVTLEPGMDRDQVRDRMFHHIYHLDTCIRQLESGTRVLQNHVHRPDMALEDLDIRPRLLLEEDLRETVPQAIELVANVMEQLRFFKADDVRAFFEPRLLRFHMHAENFYSLVEQWNKIELTSWEAVAKPAAHIFEEADCPICWMAMSRTGPAEFRTLCMHPCGHCLCQNCFQYLKQKHSHFKCPQCRTTVRAIAVIPESLPAPAPPTPTPST